MMRAVILAILNLLREPREAHNWDIVSIHHGPGLALSIAHTRPHPSQGSSEPNAVTVLHREADRELEGR